MNKDIIIGGVSLEVLKQQQTEIRKDASKVIAEHLDAGTALVEKILQEPEEDGEAVNYEALAQEALEHLQVVELVAGISGVTFMLPYYEEYGRYDSSDVLSQRMDNCEHIELAWQAKDTMYKLYSLIESLESDACAWHSSKC